MSYCSYYQAFVDRKKTWFVMATLRAEENVCFPRTLNKETTLFEFFVPQDQEELFLKIMQAYQDRGLVRGLDKLPNRLESGQKF